MTSWNVQASLDVEGHYAEYKKKMKLDLLQMGQKLIR